MNKHLPVCFRFGLIGNIFFVIFSIICLFYYELSKDSIESILFIEIMAYTAETIGFVFLLLTVIWFCRFLRHRMLMKISFSLYILFEMALMIMELNSYRIEFYHPYSIILAVVHSVISAAVCFTFLSLDSSRKAFEIVIIITVAIILFGMIGSILNIRVYFGIITNAFAYIFFFTAVIYMIRHEMIDIDCKGDKAKVTEYKSTFFE